MGNLLNYGDGYTKLDSDDDYVYKNNNIFVDGTFIAVVHGDKNSKIKKKFETYEDAYEWVLLCRQDINSGKFPLIKTMKKTYLSNNNIKKKDYITRRKKRRQSTRFIAHIYFNNKNIVKSFAFEKNAKKWIENTRFELSGENKNTVVRSIGVYS